jgi:hypothetical protein
LPFHIDHVIAQQHGGATTLDNLALACCYCNRFKGPNVASIDPHAGEVVALFNPRRHIWREYFVWQGARLSGITDAGRATVQLLQINRADAVAVRQLLMEAGIFSIRDRDLKLNGAWRRQRPFVTQLPTRLGQILLVTKSVTKSPGSCDQIAFSADLAGKKRFLEMVGVTGFEPATPTSRT